MSRHFWPGASFAPPRAALLLLTVIVWGNPSWGSADEQSTAAKSAAAALHRAVGETAAVDPDSSPNSTEPHRLLARIRPLPPRVSTRLAPPQILDLEVRQHSPTRRKDTHSGFWNVRATRPGSPRSAREQAEWLAWLGAQMDADLQHRVWELAIVLQHREMARTNKKAGRQVWAIALDGGRLISVSGPEAEPRYHEDTSLDITRPLLGVLATQMDSGIVARFLATGSMLEKDQRGVASADDSLPLTNAVGPRMVPVNSAVWRVDLHADSASANISMPTTMDLAASEAGIRTPVVGGAYGDGLPFDDFALALGPANSSATILPTKVALAELLGERNDWLRRAWPVQRRNRIMSGNRVRQELWLKRRSRFRLGRPRHAQIAIQESQSRHGRGQQFVLSPRQLESFLALYEKRSLSIARRNNEAHVHLGVPEIE